MIDKLRYIAETIRILRLPLFVFGLFCLSVAAYVIFSSTSAERYLIPSCVGVLWAMSSYFFIETFRSAPDKGDETLTFFVRLKRKLHRAWYWIIAMVFLSTTIAALYVTNKLISIWFRDFGG
jgi:1,4-dihydroxy-2-naphthoate octaprenyltransferase